jgi:hypothetical protein
MSRLASHPLPDNQNVAVLNPTMANLMPPVHEMLKDTLPMALWAQQRGGLQFLFLVDISTVAAS